MSHHVETFFDEDTVWGWQCFEPSCLEEATGFDDLDAAEQAAEAHGRES